VSGPPKLLAGIMPRVHGSSRRFGAPAIASSKTNPYGAATLNSAAPNSIISIRNNDSKYVNFAFGYLAIQRNSRDIPYDQGGAIRTMVLDKHNRQALLAPWDWSLMGITVSGLNNYGI
jgi:hypothetical protein